jgi:hypothetical protein
MQKPTVTTVLKFKTPAEREARFKVLGARFVKIDPETGAQLYKTAAGLVLRPRDQYNVEVLANCAC